MRIIDIRKAVNVELWTGRRLFIEDGDGPAVYSLPKGAMSAHRTTISFGSVTRMTVQIVGTQHSIKTLSELIAAQERPVEGWVKIG